EASLRQVTRRLEILLGELGEAADEEAVAACGRNRQPAEAQRRAVAGDETRPGEARGFEEAGLERGSVVGVARRARYAHGPPVIARPLADLVQIGGEIEEERRSLIGFSHLQCRWRMISAAALLQRNAHPTADPATSLRGPGGSLRGSDTKPSLKG